jgi:hypothetical protein
MVIGDAMTRNPPAFGGGSNLDPGAGPIQPVQFTCPRSSYDPPSYPTNSDGTKAGIQDPGNAGAGAGFPLHPCDGYASPLRADIHFPSCYNPNAGLDDYKNNMAWPNITNGKQNCPSGYTHVPHIFFELYWNTPLFNDLWTPDDVVQPFVLANGDVTGYSLHADFISGWDQTTLKTIIDTCNAGSTGMDTCPDIPGGLNDDQDCKIASPIMEVMSISDALTALPGNNPLSGWSYGSSSGSSSGSSGSSGSGSSSSGLSSSTTVYPTSLPAKPSSSTGGTPPATYRASSVASSASSASKPTYVASSSSWDGKNRKTSSLHPATELPTDKATSAQVDGGAYNTVAVTDNSGPLISTIWDIVTATETITVWAEETAVRRNIHEHAGHLAHHRRSGHMRY